MAPTSGMSRLSIFSSTDQSTSQPVASPNPHPRYSLPPNNPQGQPSSSASIRSGRTGTLTPPPLGQSSYPSTTTQSKRNTSYLAQQFPGLARTDTSGSTGPSGGGTGHQNILNRSINKGKGQEVGLSAWAFLYAEIVSYSQSRVDSVSDLEARLSALGHQAGRRIISLQLLRNAQTAGMKDPKRETRLIPVLQYIHTHVYRYCFGKPADGLEKSVDGDDEYMLTLNQPPLTQHISIPKDLSQLSCEAFTAGIIEGVLDGLEVPARVTAHTVATEQYPHRTVILIKLDQMVMDREEGLGKL